MVPVMPVKIMVRAIFLRRNHTHKQENHHHVADYFHSALLPLASFTRTGWAVKVTVVQGVRSSSPNYLGNRGESLSGPDRYGEMKSCARATVSACPQVAAMRLHNRTTDG
jgi:hypothetical protein